MSETWRVVDEAGVIHEVAVDEGRGTSRSWWAATPDVARRSHASARDAVVLMAHAMGWSIAEVLAPGVETRAAEVAHLEARRGALLAEVDRLTAVVAAARDVREEASDTLRRLSLAQQRLVAARRDDRARAKVEAYDHAARIIAEETATPPARGVCSNCERHEALCVLCGRCDPACRYRDCDGCHECRPCCECGAGGAQ